MTRSHYILSIFLINLYVPTANAGPKEIDPEAPASSFVPNIKDHGPKPEQNESSQEEQTQEAPSVLRAQKLNQTKSESESYSQERDEFKSHAGRLGLMVSYKLFSGHLGYEWYFTKFTALGTRFQYKAEMDVGRQERNYGPTAYIRLQIPHSYIFIPFYEYGAAFSSWERTEHGETIKSLNIPFQVQRVGFEMDLAEHFSIVVQEKFQRIIRLEPQQETHLHEFEVAKRQPEVLFQFKF